MKTLPLIRSALGLLLGFTLTGLTGLRAQNYPATGPLNPAQVDQLLGPIALYPDALIALILPASTTPADLVLAQRYLSTGGNPEQIDDQPWTESVKALARYPVLVKWLDDNLAWTQQLGQTFLDQPDEVMNAVQRLRARARATGALTSTAQQKLVLDGDVIEIVPAQPDVIYVPYYDPNVVYGGWPGYYYDRPYLTFGLGLPVGFWLSYDFNWRNHAIWVGDRHRNWHANGDWSHHYGAGGQVDNGNWHRWQPPVTHPPYARPDNRHANPDLHRPTPMPGAPSYPRRDPRVPEPGHAVPDNRSHEADRNHLPLPTAANSPGRREPPDSRDHHDQRPMPPVPPRPETNYIPSHTPQARVPDHGNPPSPTPPNHQDHAAPLSPGRPERPNSPNANRPLPPPPGHNDSHQFNPPPPRQVAPPPPRQIAPPPPAKDGSRDKEPEAAR